jgi:hypothetical protein
MRCSNCNVSWFADSAGHCAQCGIHPKTGEKRVVVIQPQREQHPGALLLGPLTAPVVFMLRGIVFIGSVAVLIAVAMALFSLVKGILPS